ncbi:MAG: 50S ribosomal protein L15 [Hyphomicrobium sp.]
MRLNSIKDNAGSRKMRVRIGRGIGSGVGKTGGRGGKGQTARSGVAIGGFEGGQMPLYRRLPKRGFNKWRRKNFNEVNIYLLQVASDQGKIKSGQSIDVASLVEVGILRRTKDGLRVLGSGELKTKLQIKANYVTPAARAAIEKAGGTILHVQEKVLEADELKRKKSAAKKSQKSKTVRDKSEEAADNTKV